MKFKATLAGLLLAGFALSAGDASAQPHRAGPSYLYPDPATTPGVVNFRHHAGEHRRDDLQSELVHEVDPAARLIHESPEGAATRHVALQGQDAVALRRRPLHLPRARWPP